MTAVHVAETYRLGDRMHSSPRTLDFLDPDSKPQLVDERDSLMDYKDTVNLPKTSFPMKANLGKLEQELLQRWEQEQIYQQLRQKFAPKI